MSVFSSLFRFGFRCGLILALLLYLAIGRGGCAGGNFALHDASPDTPTAVTADPPTAPHLP
ncbi:MAG: hypothetical protein OXG52_07375 [bacterium]|nr:hypothetical protein [bacterium]